ncbi:MAG: Flp pilus assembly complex ATPase component TadA [Candidatus Omnitrophica bacterium]|nr:Flp pilus assembly complex ATPase component TadA [Candidatus Omnitrophota bacterium]
MATNKPLQIGQLLINEGMITEAQLAEALEVQKKDKRKVGEILIDRKFVTENQVLTVIARIYQLPFVSLSQVRIEERVFGVIPFETLKKLKVFPIEATDQSITIAINDPLDVSALQEIQYNCGLQVKPVLAGNKDIMESLERHAESFQAARSMAPAKDVKTEIAPVISLVESLIALAIKERVSDIHLEPMVDKLRVRFRIDGVLYEKTPIAKDLERKVLTRIKILSGMDVAESRRPQDGRMLLPLQYSDYDVRVSTLPDIMGENMVMRLLDKSFTKFSLDTLGMDVHEIELIKKLIRRPYGMILVTGPTGAGKTTTLYSMINTLNQPCRNIITVEDPVEYKIPGVNQTLINVKAGYTFATAIRQMLRHDPNVIMVGEIRDMETAETAIRAALTGHLVLSTLHTNTAAGAIMRLLDMKIEPFLIQSSVIAVIAQRLVRRLCTHCKKEYVPSEEIIRSLKDFGSEIPANVTLAAPVGCEQCFDTGYSGRVAVYELLPVNEEVKRLILKSPSEADITKAAVARGMKTLRLAGLEKALSKVTTLEEIMGITFMEKE